MSKLKQRTLFYRRASWTGKSKNLQKHLTEAHSSLESTAARTFTHGEGEVQGLKVEEREGHFLMHVAYYVPHQATSVVPFPSKEKSKDTGQQLPPDEHNFMEGDIFFLVRENHIVLCPSGTSEATAVAYISHILRKAKKEKLVPKLNVEPIADVDKIKLLRNEGVKCVQLNSSLYDASEDYAERKTAKMKLLNGVAREFLDLFSGERNPALEDVEDSENITVKLEISFDARKKRGGDWSKALRKNC